MSHRDLQEECCEANRKLPETGLADLTFGNVSVLDRSSGVFAIKPSGVSYEKLRPEDMVLIDLEGNLVSGSLRPSSDTPTHHRLFQAFPGIRSVVHTHSRTAVAFAQAGRSIPCLGTTHADYFHGEVPVTRDMTPDEIRENYEWQTGEVIVECFQNLDPGRIRAVLARGHGPFAWGHSGTDAVETALALEIVANMAWKTLQLSASPPLLPPALLDKHFLRKHGSTAYYGQPVDR